MQDLIIQKLNIYLERKETQLKEHFFSPLLFNKLYRALHFKKNIFLSLETDNRYIERVHGKNRSINAN